jgi:hypothetical protein
MGIKRPAYCDLSNNAFDRQLVQLKFSSLELAVFTILSFWARTLGLLRTSAMMALMLSDGWGCGCDVGIMDATVAQGAWGSAHA